MQTKIMITFNTDTLENMDSVLTQVGLLMMKNTDKVKDFEIEHESYCENE